MRSFVLAVLLSAACLAQTAPTTNLKTWNIARDGSFTAQYATDTWAETGDADAGSTDPETILVALVNGKPREDVVIMAGIGSNPDNTYKETTETYVEQLRRDADVVDLEPVKLSEDVGMAVFIAFLRFDSNGKGIVVIDWIIPGEKNNVGSHKGIMIEGIFPASEVGTEGVIENPWYKKISAVAQTFARKSPDTPKN
jgi:hypothetical protein